MMEKRVNVLAWIGGLAFGTAYAVVAIAAPDNRAAHIAAIWGLLTGGAIVAGITLAALKWLNR